MVTPAEILSESLAKARTANRIDGHKNSYAKDNPLEYAAVLAYLDGGARPADVVSDMGLHLVLEEDARRALMVVPEPEPEPEPVPVGEGFLHPACGHIWGGNGQVAMADKDWVAVGSAVEANPNQARANGNTRLVAVTACALEPWQSDYRMRRPTQLTYGSGLSGGSSDGGPVRAPWPGVLDDLNPAPSGTIRGFNTSTDFSYIAQGAMHFALHKTDTANLLRQMAWYSWKIGGAAARGYHGIWSDNLFTGNLLTSGNEFGANGANISKTAWDAGLLNICKGLRDLGVPGVGGNTVYRSDNPAVRVATNHAMNETLQAQVSQGPTAFAKSLDEILTWQKAAPGPRYHVCMHIVSPSDTAAMRFGLALCCISGSAYIPYYTSHSDLFVPAEMKRNGQRHYLGKPTGDPVRSGNVWTREFVHTDGTEKRVTADYNNKTATFS